MRAREFATHGSFPRKLRTAIYVLPALIGASFYWGPPLHAQHSGMLIEQRDGFVDSGGVLIYFRAIGKGPPLMVLHGGPGSTHDYFLPFLLPLARQHQLVFIDERGSGRSQQLSDPKGYTLDAMVKDVEAVRVTLDLGKIDLLGHSFGGILAQAYAVAHPTALHKLILAGTGSSAARIDADLARVKNSANKATRQRIDALEQQGITDKDGAQLQEYRKLADEAELAFNYHVRLPSWNAGADPISWDVLGEMWGRKSDFHIDGNLRGFDFIPSLKNLSVPTLVIYGDHDLVTPATAEQTHAALAGSQLVEVAQSGHQTFVDQPDVFMDAVETFLRNEQ
ncbi:MAG: proline iminopeptidase-family hydrolase [Gammaproteobacteria bacterium]